MRIAIVFYSRTGNTEVVVEAMKRVFSELGVEVDVFKVSPVREYSRPLHINPRLVYDVLIRRGTEIRLVPMEPDLRKYDVVVIASPIWINTLSSPVQQFVKSCAGKVSKLVIVTTSALPIDCEKIAKYVKSLAKVRPSLCINIARPTINDRAKLQQLIQEVSKKIAQLQ